MAGPIRDLDAGSIECDVCGDEIPDREFCTILANAYNNNGNAEPRRPSREKILCGHCGTMALDNPRTGENQ